MIGLATAMVLALAPVCSRAQEIVPGPWGELKDHVKPLNITTDRERITLFRRQQMLALSAHFRAIEAVVIYGAPFGDSLAGEVRALQALGTRLDRLFVPGTGAESGAHGAREEIWQQSEKFSRHIAGFRKSVDELALAVGAGADLKAAYVGVRHQCLACHQSYRIFKPAPKARPL
jgi:cytochrome c556